MRGKIVRLVRDRGFGFIRMESGQEIFFHATGLEGGAFESLTENQEVDFESESDPRNARERAIHVRPAGEEMGEEASDNASTSESDPTSELSESNSE